MKIYISGKITGLSDEAFILFQQAEEKLVALGHTPINPMKLPHDHDKSWESYIIECLEALKECDGICLINNWKNSTGAKIELYNYMKNKDGEWFILTADDLI